jgi:hypothetical protein
LWRVIKITTRMMINVILQGAALHQLFAKAMSLKRHLKYARSINQIDKMPP